LIVLGIFLVRLLVKKENRKNIIDTLSVVRIYKYQLILFLLIYFEKNWVDLLNHPVRYTLGLDFTGLIYKLEGNFVYHFQSFFKHAVITHIMAPGYILTYIFLNYFAVVYFAFQKKTLMATKMAINYMVIYLISIPFYLLIPVDVTHQRVPGVDALLYRYSPLFLDFFCRVDPFDNCFPSLHIAIPFSLLLILWHHRKHHDIKDYDRFLYLLVGINLMYTFAILYLGVHWLTDIAGGILTGWLGYIIVETLAEGYMKRTRRMDYNLKIQSLTIASRRDTPNTYRVYVQKVANRRKKKCWRPFCGERPYKRFFFRIFAAIIDITIVLIPVTLIFGELQRPSIDYDDFWFTAFLFYLIYFIMMEYLFNATIGKAIFNLRIVSLKDARNALLMNGSKQGPFRKMGLKEIIKRNFRKLLYPLLLVDYLLGYFTRLKYHTVEKRKAGQKKIVNSGRNK